MMVLPLGITFTAILMSVSADTRTQKMMGVFLSFLIVVMDCIFYFAKNSFITYNCDGGLLLSFASLFFFAIISFIRFEDRAAKAGNIFLAFFMLSAFMGIAYWDRPTFIPTSDYTAAELAAMNSQYQDYIASFENGEGGKILPNKSKASAHAGKSGASSQKNKEDGSLSRFESYLVDAETVIKRMTDVITAIDNFEPLASNISEAERDQIPAVVGRPDDSRAQDGRIVRLQLPEVIHTVLIRVQGGGDVHNSVRIVRRSGECRCDIDIVR